jgi:hypothetical protein
MRNRGGPLAAAGARPPEACGTREVGGPAPRFEKVEREAPADGVVIEGDDL